VRLHQAAGRAVVFVGDGPSDRYAAHHADVVFAKWSLERWCRSRGIAYLPWERLSDVASWFGEALADGRLPADADDHGRWAASHQAAASFICGPETWGPGRTVSPDPL
jgi:hypothetical protein